MDSYSMAPCDEHGQVVGEYVDAVNEKTAREDAAGRIYGGMVRRLTADESETFDYGSGYRQSEWDAVAAEIDVMDAEIQRAVVCNGRR